MPLASGGHSSHHSGRPEQSCTASCETWPLTGMALRPTGQVGKTEFTGSNGSEGNHHPTQLHHCWGTKAWYPEVLWGFYSAYTQGCWPLEPGTRAAAWTGVGVGWAGSQPPPPSSASGPGQTGNSGSELPVFSAGSPCHPSWQKPFSKLFIGLSTQTEGPELAWLGTKSWVVGLAARPRDCPPP